MLDRMPLRGSTRYTPSAIKPGTSQSNPRDDGILNINTNVTRVAKVARDGTNALDFPGWNDGDPSDGEVHATKSSVRIPHRRYFNPASRSEFKVSVYVRPDDFRTSQLSRDASPNIAQKGLITDDAQWKISMRKNMSVVCSYKGVVNGDPAVRSFDSKRPLDKTFLKPNVNYRIACGWTPRVLSLTIVRIRHDGRPNVEVFDAATDPHGSPMSGIANTAKVWVGKKPNSTDADNAFAGAIDQLTISRSVA
ncbi:MAG: hypothetical protein M3353_07765 [Actinomycetota bacterium]|nr:hypothetical protein [Actinomycetota bacterium]